MTRTKASSAAPASASGLKRPSATGSTRTLLPPTSVYRRRLSSRLPAVIVMTARTMSTTESAVASRIPAAVPMYT